MCSHVKLTKFVYRKEGLYKTDKILNKKSEYAAVQEKKKKRKTNDSGIKIILRQTRKVKCCQYKDLPAAKANSSDVDTLSVTKILVFSRKFLQTTNTKFVL